MPFPLLPDPETLVLAALAAQPSITAITGTRIGSRIPDLPTYPLIRVARVGGGPDSPSSERVVVQIECWANDDATASLLARTVIAAHVDLRNATAAGWVALTNPVSVIPLFDQVSEKARYIIDVEMETGF